MGMSFGIEVVIAVIAGLYLFSYGVLRLMARVWCALFTPGGHLSRWRSALIAAVAYGFLLTMTLLMPSVNIFLPLYAYLIPSFAVAIVGLHFLVTGAPAPATPGLSPGLRDR